jgi:uncharacterized protein YrzB (UPF0473 family)
MNEEYGANFITVTDDEGNEIELEHVDTFELNGTTYMAFYPAESEDESENNEEEMGLVLLKVIEENGEQLLSTPDSDEELQAAYDEFMRSLYEEDDEEGE